MSYTKEKYLEVRNRVAKWRSVFAGWQLGTRSIDDPEAQAVRDQFDARLGLRTELSAVTRLLIDKKIFTEDEFFKQLTIETEELEKMFEKRFPGFKATDTGITIDLQKAEKTMKNWRK